MSRDYWLILKKIFDFWFTFYLLPFTFYLFLVTSPVFAELKDAGFQNRHTLRMAVRGNEYDFYLTRAQGYWDYRLPQLNRTIRIAPFFEYQSNFDTNTWWRKEAGLEIGTVFFKDCFYYGASFQHVWQKEENYSVESLEETTEGESRFVITPPLKWGIFKQKVKLHLFNEYTYDFTRGQPTCNEVGVSLDWRIFPWLALPVGWRHIDRIHDFDSDTLELSVLFSF